jgi:hypothetical protein
MADEKKSLALERAKEIVRVAEFLREKFPEGDKGAMLAIASEIVRQSEQAARPWQWGTYTNQGQ